MMLSRARASAMVVLALSGCGLVAACGQPGPATSASQAQKVQKPQQAQHATGRFTAPLDVSNQMFPLVAGTQFTYQGTIVEGGETKQHSVVFTVTGLSKLVDHVRTVVALDQDFRDGTMQEQELAFFAQDDAKNVWNFGEYPEEYDNGKLTGAPSTWIRQTDGAYGGIHVQGNPVVGMQWREGLVPAIQFDDVSKITSTGQTACVPTGCYHQVMIVDETSPNDPTSGHQIKYYAAGTGLVRVGANGGDTQEFLKLTAVRHLDGPALAKMRAEALAMDKRAYRVSKVYRTTEPARNR